MLELTPLDNSQEIFRTAFGFAQRQVREMVRRDPDFYPMYTEGGAGAIARKLGRTGATASCQA